MTRTAALKRWSIAGTDIRVAFLIAPKRNANKLTAMEVPTVFKRLGLAAQDDIWLIEKALYGLVSSPRDWCVHRDEVMPTISWRRTRQGAVVVGHFIKTPDENIWRMEEVEVENGVRHWSGLLSVYVDDLLIAAEEGASSAAMQAIAKVWAISDVELAGINQSIKYCGFEIEVPHDGDGFIVSQKKYQQELMTRWNISEKVAYPAYKISEDEELPQQHIEQKDIKEAQALTGALLWLSTRTRPDLCQGVAAMSRLVTRNPLKAIQIGHILLKYVNGNPGGMHFPSEVNPWGKRDQLKIKRHEKSLEIYADIAYAASAGHRSIQGLVVMFAGVPIGWQTCQQPFVTHSTAEAELVSYCEGLLAGRATEALLCAMWGEELTNNSFERVMYGDNVAAIGLAHGTTTSSWRTRHLRIRSSLLKEALDEKQAIYGGPWKLIHLKGTELVADGCTKPLNGQAFFRFLEDLGLQRGDCDGAAEEPQVSGPAPISEVSGGGGFAAAKALILGSALLSSAKGASDDDDETDYTPFLVTGAVLMALGTIYAGQVIHSASSYCLRRLCGPGDRVGHGFKREESSSSDDEKSILVLSDDEGSEKQLQNAPSGSTSKGKGTRSGSGSAARTMSRSSMPHSGSSNAVCSTSKSLTRQSGLSSSSGEPRRSDVGGRSSAGASSSLGLTGPSGSGNAAGSTSSLDLRPRSGLQSVAAGEPAEAPFCADAAADVDVEKEESRSKGSQIPNPWNLFQHQHKNQHLTSTQLARMYQDGKSKGAKMP